MTEHADEIHVDIWPAVIGKNNDDPVPVYTEADTARLINWPDIDPALSAHLQLPLTRYPTLPYLVWDPTLRKTVAPTAGYASDPTLSIEQKRTLYTIQCEMIQSFFAAILAKNVEAVALFLSRGLVSPDVSDQTGRTPLIAAVEAGNGAMVCTLVGLGAGVDAYGSVATGTGITSAERTPLMVAAARGNLALVKLLVEDFGANDAALAPDGQLALRLAADAGHREVVEYLPARRGGAWRRWRAHHAVAIGRAARAARRIYLFVTFFVKVFVWDVPKHVVVLPTVKGCKFCWKNKHRFAGWCKRQAKEMPARAGRAAKGVWNVARKTPGKVWKAVKRIPGAARRLVEWLWKVVKRIPGAMKTVCVFIWDSLKRAGKAVGHVFLRVVSALHTAVAAVLDFFRRITLKDVWNGVCDVFRAVFATLPRAIWKIANDAAKVILMTILGLFGLAGEAIILLFKVLWYIAMYVPQQAGKILAEIWASIAKGYHEVMVWFNPKH
ncbi:Ankyrin repeat domain-containing protein 50 [Madurella mycetomatis]|uniref:Ankyrin repeat domain-containing protein 50 n=1 Tax=Madurella mycetomatis TaxID=100816 RepID=A0A175VQJ0_9PEZI|nr:Ankyrin repeat domain-containing protein 50 [Madurella mycetomatis]